MCENYVSVGKLLGRDANHDEPASIYHLIQAIVITIVVALLIGFQLVEFAFIRCGRWKGIALIIVEVGGGTVHGIIKFYLFYTLLMVLSCD